ncbi:MAG: DUF4091 domain-containing protein [Candidatus Hydrogenedentes bacterium]|nr:DUF4091 domain-containing protein [Candidatus Hydrogenedentota bacterium]
MRILFLLGAWCALAAGAGAAVIDADAVIESNYIGIGFSPEDGGALHTFQILTAPGNFASGDGLLQEGFGVGSHYVPNRRLNERLESDDSIADRPVMIYSYDCDGPNIAGLHSTRTMNVYPNESGISVTWTVENKGKEAQWVAPWVENNAAPGGSISEYDRLDVPALEGLIQPKTIRYYRLARNWIAFTDPVEETTLFAVFDANEAHSVLTLRTPPNQPNVLSSEGFKVAFVPRLMKPGAVWSTTYRLNAVRGLKRVDFACDELAGALEYQDKKLVLLLSAIKDLPDVTITARVLGPNGRVWPLPDKKFTLAPNRLSRCTWEWEAPGDGAYELLAQLSYQGKPIYLGKATHSPHGGIDTRFTVGKAVQPAWDAWTDAPYALEMGARTVKGQLLQGGELPIWLASGLEKVFQQDRIDTNAKVDPVLRVKLAKREAEAFQIVFQPPAERTISLVNVEAGVLTHSGGGATIPASAITLRRVQYHNVGIPSHFEGPTGNFPDALLPYAPFSAVGGVSSPVWITVQAPPDAEAGTYRGTVVITGEGMDPVSLSLEVEVFDFALPQQPALKTDFGFWPEAAMRGAKAQGGGSNEARLLDAYRKDGFAHRVTLRELTQFPLEQPNYGAALDRYLVDVKAWRAAGATTFAVPPSLLESPDALQAANTFVVKNQLQDAAFVPLADEPEEPAYPRVLEALQQWKTLAPAIPVNVATFGLRPFAPDDLDQWNLHAQIFDTVYNKDVFQRIVNGGEVWWYVNHTPPRPYGNFFVDFAGIDHRILFWQAWGLGVRGMHYWNVNYVPEGQDAFDSLLDATPVNGDGLLVYPGPEGPIPSIRWEIIRDGLEDYDYFFLFNQLRERLLATPGHEALLKEAAVVYNLNELLPSLVTYTRDAKLLLARREAVARMIVKMTGALEN